MFTKFAGALSLAISATLFSFSSSAQVIYYNSIETRPATAPQSTTTSILSVLVRPYGILIKMQNPIPLSCMTGNGIGAQYAVIMTENLNYETYRQIINTVYSINKRVFVMSGRCAMVSDTDPASQFPLITILDAVD